MPETTAAKKTAAPKASGAKPGPLAPEASTWDRLAADFPADWIEKLPKTLKARDDNRGVCEQGSWYSADGHACGKYHARAVHLDYVGHAGITMRLNDVLGPGGWDFQPMATSPDGLPIISGQAFWAKLTVVVDGEEVTKWDMATNFSGPQEAIGDALRRCAMRFGVGTYLWSKSDQALDRAKAASDTEPPPEPEPRAARQEAPEPESMTQHAEATFARLRDLSESERHVFGPWWEREAGAGNLPLRANIRAITPAQATWVAEVIDNMRARAAEQAASAEQEAQPQGAGGEAPPDPQ